jgi:hypothetical protein
VSDGEWLTASAKRVAPFCGIGEIKALIICFIKEYQHGSSAK